MTYIDDNLVMASTREEAKCLAEISVALLEALGFLINYPKSTLEPCQELQFLGFSINSVEMTIRVPQTKLEKMREQVKSLLKAPTLSGREIASFVGTASSMALGIPPAPLFYRALQHAKNAVIHTPLGLIPLDTPLKEELHAA